MNSVLKTILTKQFSFKYRIGSWSGIIYGKLNVAFFLYKIYYFNNSNQTINYQINIAFQFCCIKLLKNRLYYVSYGNLPPNKG